MKDFQASVCRYQSQPLGSIDNDKLWLNNSSYHAQPHLIIVKYKITKISFIFIPGYCK